jgi:putative redox protein
MASVHVTSNRSQLSQAITIRDFQLTSDEPVTADGDNAGPTPVELLLASLGACKTMTVKIYANRKGWPLEQVSIDVQQQKNGNYQWISAQLHLTGSLTDEQRDRLRQIADRCPVHKLLTTELEVQTVLAAAS